MSEPSASRRPGRRVDARANRARIVELTLAGLGPAEIAAESGLAPRTVRGHLADPEVMSELRGLQDDRLRQISRRILDAALGAVAVLAEVVQSKEASALARVSAARALLTGGQRWIETIDLNNRLAAVEQRLEEADEGSTSLG